MASFIQQLAADLGIGSAGTGASTVSQPTNASGVALSLQLSNNAILSGAEKLLVAAPGGATVTAGGDTPAVIIGSTGIDHLTGSSSNDVIVGGPGTNVMSGMGGTDVFGHQTGATDYITDFSGAAGEKIALSSGLHYTGSQAVTVDPTTVGLTGSPTQSLQLSFSDGSTVTLIGSHETADTNWFI